MRKILLPILFISLGAFFYSCDDSGVNPPTVPAGTITIVLKNMKPLNTAVDGFYRFWLIAADSSLGGVFNKDMGKFNVRDDGGLVDSAGNSASFTLGADSLVLPFIKYAMITAEPPGSIGNPFQTVLLACPMTYYVDSISGALKLNDTVALGSIGTVLQTIDVGLYILNVTTNPGLGCRRGLWFCDTLGTPLLPAGISLRNNMGWTYEAWLVNNVTNTFYPIGRFFRRDTLDFDGAGPCSGPLQPRFNVPGQEWTIDGCSDLTNIGDGNFGVFVTLTPSSRNAATPYPLKVFEQALIDHTLGCGQLDNVFSKRYVLPYGRIRIARVRI